MLKHILFTCFLFFTAIPLLKAQGCGKLKKAVFSIELDEDEEEAAEE